MTEHRTTAVLGVLLILVFACSCGQSTGQETAGSRTQSTGPSATTEATNADQATDAS